MRARTPGTITPTRHWRKTAKSSVAGTGATVIWLPGYVEENSETAYSTRRAMEFIDCRAWTLQNLPLIKGLGVAGFMRLPSKDTRFFTHIERLPERYYPRNPRSA